MSLDEEDNLAYDVSHTFDREESHGMTEHSELTELERSGNTESNRINDME